MDDPRFEAELVDEMYSNEAILHILIEAGEAAAMAAEDAPTVEQLVELRRTTPTIEHVFCAVAQRSCFPSHGFETSEQYERLNNQVGICVSLKRTLTVGATTRRRSKNCRSRACTRPASLT